MAARKPLRTRDSRPTEPVLDIQEIQGNSLAGFNKDHQQLVVLRIQSVVAARSWLRRILPAINTLAEVGHFNATFRIQRVRLGRDPDGMIATWANIAFSYPALSLLTSKAEADGVPDSSFRDGLAARSSILGDPPPHGSTDPTAEWVVGKDATAPDVLLVVASDDPDQLRNRMERMLPIATDGAQPPAVVWQETGDTRPDLPGHEHFGFRDAVSQPGIRGRNSARPGDFLTPRLLNSSPLPDMEFSAPGQPLVWPGQFVFGYPSTDGQSGSTGGPVASPPLNPAWLKNGSLLVFRRLKQDVARFNQFLWNQATALATNAAFAGLTAGQLGAMIVGRWPSGAPLLRSPLTDDVDLGNDPLARNDFLLTVNTPPPDLKRGHALSGVYPSATADALGFMCPHAAHIRKVNPRDQDSDKGDQFDTLTRRIIRRGIPFGPPITDPMVDDGVDRGLHFLCYQTSIINQFELLQTDWANSTANPQAGGFDLVIGQNAGQPRAMELSRSTGTVDITAPAQFVIPTGGGYYFAPSISALRDVLARSTV